MLLTPTFRQVIVFNFSKKECEALALQMQSLDLNDDAERALVDGIFSNAVSIVCTRLHAVTGSKLCCNSWRGLARVSFMPRSHAIPDTQIAVLSLPAAVRSD